MHPTKSMRKFISKFSVSNAFERSIYMLTGVNIPYISCTMQSTNLIATSSAE